jgi:septum formation protein
MPRRLILASGSSRRQELLAAAGFAFDVIVPNVDETVPPGKRGSELAISLARAKAQAVRPAEVEAVVVGADTIVEIGNRVLGKPKGPEDATAMLRSLSGNTHSVTTGVCIITEGTEEVLSEVTQVTFNDLTDRAIQYYVSRFKPFDKAGAYAIQEWIGLIGISRIEGDYFNVVGLPINRVASILNRLLETD